MSVLNQGKLMESTHQTLMAQIRDQISELERCIIAEMRHKAVTPENVGEKMAARRRAEDAREKLERLIDHAIINRTMP